MSRPPLSHRVAAGVLGAADGVTSISGVIAGGAAAHISHKALAVTALGGALAATVSMGGAEMLSEDATDWPAIGAMAIGTLAGAGLPAIPLLFGGEWWAVGLIAFALSLVVGEVRHRALGKSWWLCEVQTLAVLIVGGLVGYGAGRFL